MPGEVPGEEAAEALLQNHPVSQKEGQRRQAVRFQGLSPTFICHSFTTRLSM